MRVLCGDMLTLPLPQAQMVFADPPDNLGLNYGGVYRDKVSVSGYKLWLCQWLERCRALAPVVWFSVNAKWQSQIWLAAPSSVNYETRLVVWRYTFGQHREFDLGGGYRCLFRIAPVGYAWHTDHVRVMSQRLLSGDSRANPLGRVPDDVWDFPRVVGNAAERRPWHPTQHPVALVERAVLLSTLPGDLVVDPFMGTGATMRACLAAGRDCVTSDISPVYCQHVREELSCE